MFSVFFPVGRQVTCREAEPQRRSAVIGHEFLLILRKQNSHVTPSIIKSRRRFVPSLTPADSDLPPPSSHSAGHRVGQGFRAGGGGASATCLFVIKINAVTFLLAAVGGRIWRNVMNDESSRCFLVFLRS